MRIAVTGANGFIGQALSLFLQQNLKTDIVSIIRSSSAATNNVLSLSASDEELITQLRDIDCLIHLAARAHTNNSTPADFERDNIFLTERIARICVSANIPRLIYLSSIKVNGNSTQGRAPFSADELPQANDIYGQSKLASEQILKQCLFNTNTAFVIIRPPLVYGMSNKGNLGTLDSFIKKGIPLPFGHLNNKRDLVSMENLCSLITLCIAHPNAANETFLISDGIARSTNEILVLLAKQQGTNAKIFSIPNWIFSAARLLKPQMIERLTGNLQVDIDKTQTLLTWSPRN